MKFTLFRTFHWAFSPSLHLLISHNKHETRGVHIRVYACDFFSSMLMMTIGVIFWFEKAISIENCQNLLTIRMLLHLIFSRKNAIKLVKMTFVYVMNPLINPHSMCSFGLMTLLNRAKHTMIF